MIVIFSLEVIAEGRRQFKFVEEGHHPSMHPKVRGGRDLISFAKHLGEVRMITRVG